MSYIYKDNAIIGSAILTGIQMNPRKLIAAAMLLILTNVAYAADSARRDRDDDDDKKERPDKIVRTRFFNFSYMYDKIRLSERDFQNFSEIFDETESIVKDRITGVRNNYGFSLTRGRTYAFHKKPIARLVTIGLDAVFFDVSYSNYSLIPATIGVTVPGQADSYVPFSTETTMHRLEYSLQVGPSVILTPGQSITVAAYFRYAPTFSSVCLDGSWSANYATLFTTGASATFGKLGVGIEARFGNCNYKHLTGVARFSDSMVRSAGLRAFVQVRW